MVNKRATLTVLWIFAVLNFVYADVVELFYTAGSIQAGTGIPGAIQYTQGLLLGASVLVEIPMAMVVLSWTLKHKVNRWANIIIGAVYTVVTLATQFIVPIMNGTTTTFYLFFGAIEILTTSFIVWYGWKWRAGEDTVSMQ